MAFTEQDMQTIASIHRNAKAYIDQLNLLISSSQTKQAMDILKQLQTELKKFPQNAQGGNYYEVQEIVGNIILNLLSSKPRLNTQILLQDLLGKIHALGSQPVAATPSVASSPAAEVTALTHHERIAALEESMKKLPKIDANRLALAQILSTAEAELSNNNVSEVNKHLADAERVIINVEKKKLDGAAAVLADTAPSKQAESTSPPTSEKKSADTSQPTSNARTITGKIFKGFGKALSVIGALVLAGCGVITLVLGGITAGGSIASGGLALPLATGVMSAVGIALGLTALVAIAILLVGQTLVAIGNAIAKGGETPAAENEKKLDQEPLLTEDLSLEKQKKATKATSKTPASLTTLTDYTYASPLASKTPITDPSPVATTLTKSANSTLETHAASKRV